MTQCKLGNEEFPSQDGKGKERGHSDNGFAKIALIIDKAVV